MDRDNNYIDEHIRDNLFKIGEELHTHTQDMRTDKEEENNQQPIERLKRPDPSIVQKLKQIQSEYTQGKKQDNTDTLPQYRIIEAISGKFYVQVLNTTTTTKGYLWWKKTIVNSNWKSLTRIGTIPFMGLMYQHKNNKAKSYSTLKEAEAFLSRIKQGERVYGSC